MIVVLLLQIVTENAGTTSPETPILQTRFEVTRSAHLTDFRAVETFFWAPDASMDFALSLPIALRDLDDATLDGLGDATLRWKLSLWKEDDVMESTRFSAIAGVKLPTGSVDDDSDVPRKLQLGTGSFDLFGGPLFTLIRDRHRFAAELIGRYDFESQGFRLQPSLRLGLAYWYRLTPERIEQAGEEVEVRAVIELTSIFYGESRYNDSGLGDEGNITWLSPGLQVYPALWILVEASVQFPIFQNVDDAQGDRRFGVLFSIKILF